MASTAIQSTHSASTQSKSKESKVSMAITNVLNNTQSQLPTPDVSPNEPAINDLSQIPSATQTITSSIPLRDQDYLLLSPSAESSPPLFQAHRSASHSRTASSAHSRRTSQNVAVLQSQLRRATIEPSDRLAQLGFPKVAKESPMPNKIFQLVGYEPENPDDPEGPREAVLKSQAWTNAAKYPNQYWKSLCSFNRATYASGEAPRLNILADVSAARAEQMKGSSASSRLSSSLRVRQQGRLPGQKLEEGPRTAPSRRTRGKRRGSEDATDATPPKRQRSEAQKKKKYDHFTEIVNYCPDIRTERLSQPFVFEQKPNKIDLSNEPEDLRNRMTETELAMASNLRLNCNNFLINKRLIFKGKIEHLIANQPFSKTHAQLYGVIDVNKSSQMFSYFDAAGWMSDSALAPFTAKEKARRHAEKQSDMKREDAVEIKVV